MAWQTIFKLAESQAKVHGHQTWLLPVCHSAPGRGTLEGELLLPPRGGLNTCMADAMHQLVQ